MLRVPSVPKDKRLQHASGPEQQGSGLDVAARALSNTRYPLAKTTRRRIRRAPDHVAGYDKFDPAILLPT
jgi:hypothetical protein